jgi:predicted amidohydrolase
MAKIRVSAIQMDIALGNAERNRSQALRLVEDALRRGSKIVVLPELWLTGYARNIHELAEDVFRGPTVTALVRLAREYNAYIFGSIPEKGADGRLYNSMPIVTPNGVVDVYRKAHMFKLINEHLIFSPGNKLVVLDTEFGRVGFAICYDIRFTEMIRAMVFNGIKILVVPAEWPCQRVDAWIALVRGRAVENQIYVIAANRVGKDDTGRYCGHSAIVNPYGDYVAEAGSKEEVILTADIDLEEVDRAREQVLALKDLAPEIYRNIAIVKG